MTDFVLSLKLLYVYITLYKMFRVLNLFLSYFSKKLYTMGLNSGTN